MDCDVVRIETGVQDLQKIEEIVSETTMETNELLVLKSDTIKKDSLIAEGAVGDSTVTCIPTNVYSENKNLETKPSDKIESLTLLLTDSNESQEEMTASNLLKDDQNETEKNDTLLKTSALEVDNSSVGTSVPFSVEENPENSTTAEATTSSSNNNLLVSTSIAKKRKVTSGDEAKDSTVTYSRPRRSNTGTVPLFQLDEEEEEFKPENIRKSPRGKRGLVKRQLICPAKTTRVPVPSKATGRGRSRNIGTAKTGPPNAPKPRRKMLLMSQTTQAGTESSPTFVQLPQYIFIPNPTAPSTTIDQSSSGTKTGAASSFNTSIAQKSVASTNKENSHLCTKCQGVVRPTKNTSTQTTVVNQTGLPFLITAVEKRYKDLKTSNRGLKSKVRRLEKKIENLQLEMKGGKPMRGTKEIINSAKGHMSDTALDLFRLLLTTELDKSLTNVRYAECTKEFALSLYCCSKTAYRVCQSVFKLPSIRSLLNMCGSFSEKKREDDHPRNKKKSEVGKKMIQDKQDVEGGETSHEQVLMDTGIDELLHQVDNPEPCTSHNNGIRIEDEVLQMEDTRIHQQEDVELIMGPDGTAELRVL